MSVAELGETLGEAVLDDILKGHCNPRRCALTSENAGHGLAQLAMAIVNLLHELLERQAIRRMEGGTLTEDEVERVGSCLMQQSLAIDELCGKFGLKRQDLNIDLGPLGKLI